MGPPGAGKGTQAEAVATRLDIPAISTGDIFRRHAEQGSALGEQAERYMDSGDYVPDEVTNAMVRERIREDDARSGFLLDGYPRTPAQVDELDAMLAELGCRLDAVVLLEVDKEELIDRLLKRARTENRTDDTESVIRRRQEVFAEQTAPLVDVYGRRGLLVRVDGVGAVDEVRGRVLAALPERTAGDR
ncbi:adenylate kinase [soil metagenome]